MPHILFHMLRDALYIYFKLENIMRLGITIFINKTPYIGFQYMATKKI